MKHVMWHYIQFGLCRSRSYVHAGILLKVYTNAYGTEITYIVLNHKLHRLYNDMHDYCMELLNIGGRLRRLINCL